MHEQHPHLRQVEKLANSSVLHGSEALRKLLRYLARQAVAHPGAPLKEYQIATEEFGRPPEFDPAVDSMVRVQVGRLRAKLAEYYAKEGADDPIRVELPKGSYTLAFHHRQPGEAHPPASLGVSHVAARSAPVGVPRKWIVAVIVLSVLLAAAVAALVFTRRGTPVANAAGEKAAPTALRAFWKPFLFSPDEPWLVFSNAAFIGRPETGMRYYDSARDLKNAVWDHYTGVGEVLAVHNLTQVFSSLHRGLRVKRGSLFTLDDAKNDDLIFVGSPSENLTLLELPGTHEFVFQRVDSGTRKGDLAIFNVHPRSGESSYYLASPSATPLSDDYAVVGFFPGLNPARSVLIIAGTTTFGTQGAVEFLCRQNTVEGLLRGLSVSETGEMKPFEALLHIKIAKGVPVESELVSVRRIPNP
jgi:hypothetical protein